MQMEAKVLHLAYFDPFSQTIAITELDKEGECIVDWNSKMETEWVLPVAPLLLTGSDRRRRVFTGEDLKKLKNDDIKESNFFLESF